MIFDEAEFLEEYKAARAEFAEVLKEYYTVSKNNRLRTVADTLLILSDQAVDDVMASRNQEKNDEEKDFF